MINYKHLHYFWVTAKQGGIVRASEKLHITPQTISGQISLLQDSIGRALFRKSGRKLELTEAGRLVLSYADEIFSLGDDLEDAVKNISSNRTRRLKVGIADGVPKTITYRLLAPAIEESVKIICRENSLNNLLAELALHRLDLVIADGPVPPGLGVRSFNHALGKCGISFVAVSAIARDLRNNFPLSLDRAPLLIPSETNLLHGRLLQWFDKLHIHPRIVGEFDDSALMKTFGIAGEGVFIVPSAIVSDVVKNSDVEIVGETDEVEEHFYVISSEKKITNPSIAAIKESACEWLKI